MEIITIYTDVCSEHQVIKTQTFWGETTCLVWLPTSDAVVRVPASMLKPLESVPAPGPRIISPT